VRPVGVARHLRLLPGRQRPVELPQHLARLAVERDRLALHVHPRRLAGERAQLLGLALDLGQGFLELEVVHRRLIRGVGWPDMAKAQAGCNKRPRCRRDGARASLPQGWAGAGRERGRGCDSCVSPRWRSRRPARRPGRTGPTQEAAIDCAAWDDIFEGYDLATSRRFCFTAERLGAVPPERMVEVVARAIGQAGCPEGWPADPFALEAQQARAKGHLVRALGLDADEAAFFYNDVDGLFYDALEALAAQGRLVSVTANPDELLPRACAGG
jgi:hypothetical protein